LERGEGTGEHTYVIVFLERRKRGERSEKKKKKK
jgi:hypothetical protein